MRLRALFVVLVVAGAFFYIAESASAAPLVTYTNSAFRYSLKFPSDWEIGNNPAIEGVSAIGTHSSGYPIVMSVIPHRIHSIDWDFAKRDRVAYMRQQLAAAGVKKVTLRSSTVAKKRSVIAIFPAPEPGVVKKITYIFNDYDYFEIGYASAQSVLNDFRTTLDEIIKSINFNATWAAFRDVTVSNTSAGVGSVQVPYNWVTESINVDWALQTQRSAQLTSFTVLNPVTLTTTAQVTDTQRFISKPVLSDVNDLCETYADSLEQCVFVGFKKTHVGKFGAVVADVRGVAYDMPYVFRTLYVLNGKKLHTIQIGFPKASYGLVKPEIDQLLHTLRFI